ncbi:acetolactate decarboxylase [Acetobacterium bakii]|uniref:Alpha-acetolactate decarboxylase n=1 Tax=Acetobacterium bakii TaxID=52689 RepID=A0A0L6TXT1_9FIRM|nr:acetolactate decarboxylase [Acetobacterium bakii]KNZ40365.1 alpha-acetolactate decarboxylase [Acetobacterium bakii]
MKTKIKLTVLSVVCLCVLSGCANTSGKELSRDTLYQVSTISSLLAGNYDGFQSFGELKEHGDVGIGTFNALDGELVMIDNTVYKVKSTGAVEEASDTDTTPFAAVTYFDDDATQELTAAANLAVLEQELDKLIQNKDLFYIFKVDGTFKTIKTRSVPIQEKPYPVLSEAVKEQSVFDYTNITGTLVGLWCPEYIGGVNVPGYHLHFISEDRTKGGHLLDVSFDQAQVSADATDGFVMTLSPITPEGSVKDLDSEIDAVEK